MIYKRNIVSVLNAIVFLSFSLSGCMNDQENQTFSPDELCDEFIVYNELRDINCLLDVNALKLNMHMGTLLLFPDTITRECYALFIPQDTTISDWIFNDGMDTIFSKNYKLYKENNSYFNDLCKQNHAVPFICVFMNNMSNMEYEDLSKSFAKALDDNRFIHGALSLNDFKFKQPQPVIPFAGHGNYVTFFLSNNNIYGNDTLPVECYYCADGKTPPFAAPTGKRWKSPTRHWFYLTNM